MTDPDTILKLDQDRREAMVRADVPALSAMFADDLMWIHANGRADTKDTLLGSIGLGETRYLAIKPAGETVRFYGGLALISGIVTIKAEMAGQLLEVQNRYTIVWAPGADGWQVVNWQSTSAPKTA